jgi:hypothetical protein
LADGLTGRRTENPSGGFYIRIAIQDCNMRLPRSGYLALAGTVIFLGWSANLGGALPQQVGFVDLTGIHDATKPPAGIQKHDLPEGCKKLVPGVMGDGIRETDDGQPRDIEVAVTGIETSRPTLGSGILADVQLRNTGTEAIQIPWSTDGETIRVGQGPTSFVWEEGSFDLVLKQKNADGVLLTSLNKWVFSTKYAVGSERTIPAGGYISALVRFKVEDEFSIHKVQAGDWLLSATWTQAERERSFANCAVSSIYFRDNHYYRQVNPTITLHVFPNDATSSGGH